MGTRQMWMATQGGGVAVQTTPPPPGGLLSPGPNWDGTAGSGGSPTPDSTRQGTGFIQKAIGNFDEPYETYITADMDIGVIADVGDDAFIAHVVFWLEGNTQTVMAQTLNGRTGGIGWVSTISYDGFTASSDAYLYATIYPVNGYPRQVGPLRLIRMDSRPQYYLNWTSGSDSNNGTSSGAAWKTFNHAARNAPSGAEITMAAGTYSEEGMGSAGPFNNPANPITFKRAGGTTLGDVAITQTSYVDWFLPCTRIVFDGIEVDCDAFHKIQGRPPPAFYIWQNCRLTDYLNGVGPVPYGVYNSYVATRQTFLSSTTTGPGKNAYHAIVDTEFTCSPATGWWFCRGCTLNSGWDAVALGAAQPNTVCLNTQALRTGDFIQRKHIANTITVTSVTYNAGAGTTAIVWSGTPAGMVAVSNNTDISLRVRFQTGAAADPPGTYLYAQGFQVISTSTPDNVTWTTVVEGDARAAAAPDTATIALLAHGDAWQIMQLGTKPSQPFIPFDNIIFQRYLATSADTDDDPSQGGWQPMLPQPGHVPGYGTITTVGAALTCSDSVNGHALVVGDYVKPSDVIRYGVDVEGRRVVAVNSPTTATLNAAFSSDLVSEAWTRVKTVQNFALQLCIFDGPRPTKTNNSQWSGGIQHAVMRQCTWHCGNQAFCVEKALVMEDCYFKDSIWQQMAYNPWPSNCVVGRLMIDNNHFEKDSNLQVAGNQGRGTNYDVGAITMDNSPDDGHPGHGTWQPISGVSRTIATPALKWDYWGNAPRLDGSDLVGAVGEGGA